MHFFVSFPTFNYAGIVYINKENSPDFLLAFKTKFYLKKGYEKLDNCKYGIGCDVL